MIPSLTNCCRIIWIHTSQALYFKNS